MPLFQLVLNSLPLGLGILVKYAFFRKIGFGKDYIDGLKEEMCIRDRDVTKKGPIIL